MNFTHNLRIEVNSFNESQDNFPLRMLMGFLHHQNNECGFKDHIDGQEVWDSISVANFGSFHITSLKFGNEISVVIFLQFQEQLKIGSIALVTLNSFLWRDQPRRTKKNYVFQHSGTCLFYYTV